jgi:hypothetical protein
MRMFQAYTVVPTINYVLQFPKQVTMMLRGYKLLKTKQPGQYT